MNPMTRKMFKSRDARTKLRGMGGILASSPELAQTVQQFQDGGNVDAGFGSNVEYTYSTFLAENNLNDTPQAREMFARYKSLMDTRDPLTDPQLFSPVGFDRAPPRLAGLPVQFQMYQDTVRGSEMGNDRPFFSRFENDIYSMGEPLNVGQRRMGYGDTRSIGPQRPGGTDAAFTRQTSPAAPAAPPPSTLDQLRSSVYSNNPLEDALAGTGLDSNVIGTSVIDPVMTRLDQAVSREPMQSQTAADVAAEVALRNRERASENAGRLTSEELMSPDPVRPGAAPELTAEELAMQAYAESLAQQYAPIGEDLQRMDEAVSEFGKRLVAPKVGPEAVTFPGAEGRAIIRGDLTAADMMPPPPITPDLPAEERRMDYVTEGETPVVEPPEGETPAPDAETPAPDGDAGTGTGTLNVDPKKLAPLMPQPGDTDADVRAKYKDRLKLFQEILGEDEAGARNKGMDLAMIGLAIMSGQSPNFLTNIAQGGAAGLKAMSARDEAARERQRLVRTTALESVLDEEAADKAAAADLAGRNFSRQTQLMVAQLRNTGVDLTEKAAILFNNTYNSTLEAEKGRGTKSAAVKSGEMTADQSAAAAANAAVQNFLERFGAGSVLSVPGGQPPPSAVSSPQELEAAAKAAGRPTFVYNGMEYPVR